MTIPTRTLRLLSFAAVLMFGLLYVGCASRQEPSRWTAEMLDRGPGPSVEIDESWPNVFIEQRVEIDWGEDAQRFRAVVQKRGDLLELILLDPMGRPGFRIYQEGLAVGVENFTQRTLPFEGTYILADVQKAFGPWLAAEDERIDGAHRSFCETGLCLVEERDGQRLVSRQFTRDDLSEQDVVDVRYHYDGAAEEPSTIVLDNAWFGYVLRIEILDWQAL